MSDDKFIGREIRDYHLLEIIGQGSFGTVYKAVKNEDTFAFKILDPRHTENLDKVKALNTKFRELRKLNNKYVINIEYNGKIGNQYYLVIPLKAYTLERLIPTPNGVSLTIDEIIHILKGIADGIDYLHKKEIIHCDVKPSNILIEELENGRQPYITDYAIVNVLRQSGKSSYLRDIIGGTPEYMSPEAWNGQVTKSRDIYALGIMVYQLITGELPFSQTSNSPDSDDNEDNPVKSWHENDYPDENAKNKLLEKTNELFVEQVIKAIAKNPQRRFETCTDFVNALEMAYQVWPKIYGLKLRTLIKIGEHRYLINRMIKWGSSGIVYSAHRSGDDTNTYAIKFFWPSHSSLGITHEDIKKCVKIEREVSDKMRNHVIHIRDQDEYDIETFEHPIPIIVTDCTSKTLRDLLQEQSGLDFVRKHKHLFEKLAKAIDTLHDNDILHRDIKPENILIEIDVKRKFLPCSSEKIIRPYLSDFSKAYYKGQPYSKFHSSDDYKAPALWTNSPNATDETDLYAFAMIVYEAVQGRLPFSGKNEEEKEISHRIESVALLGDLNNKPIDFVIRKALPRAKEKVEYTSAVKFVEDLYNAIDDTNKSRRQEWIGSWSFYATILATIFGGLAFLAILFPPLTSEELFQTVTSVAAANLESPTDVSTATSTSPSTLTNTPEVTPTFTLTDTETPTPTSTDTPLLTITVNNQSLVQVTPTPQLTALAIVRAASARLRTGPSAHHPAPDGANEGDILTIIGQSGNPCWLNVIHPDVSLDRWIACSIVDIQPEGAFIPTIPPESIRPSPTFTPSITPIPPPSVTPTIPPFIPVASTPIPAATQGQVDPPAPPNPPTATPNCISVTIHEAGNTNVGTEMRIRADTSPTPSYSRRYQVHFELTGPNAFTQTEREVIYPYNFPSDEGAVNRGWTPTQAGRYTMRVTVTDLDNERQQCNPPAIATFTVTE